MSHRLARSGISALPLPPFDPLNQRAAELRRQGHRVISLGQAVPFFGPPASAVDAARAALDGDAPHRYVSDPGLLSLRVALADRLAPTIDGGLSADDLIITAGGNHAWALALMTLVDPGDEVILPAPYFTNHEGMIQAHGAVPVEAPLEDRDGFAVRWSDIAPHITTRTRAVVLCNPSNPTGAPVSPGDGVRIVAELADRNIALVSDETYMHFLYGAAPHWSAASVAGWRRNVVVTGTFSKSFGMMGWRAGFMLADAGLCAEAVKVQDAMIICAPTISQIAVEAAVRHDWGYPATHHAALLERRHALLDAVAALPGAHWIPHDAALFAFVRIDGCADSVQLSHTLLERAHVVTIPGAAFGTAGEGHLRLSYGYATPAEITEAVARIATCLVGGGTPAS